MVEAYDKHNEDEAYAVGYAVGTHTQVATVAHQLVVEEYHHHAGAALHEEGRDAYLDDILYQIGFESVYAPLQVEQLVFVGKDAHLVAQRYRLRDYRGPRRTAYAPTEDPDEERVEQYVHHHREDGGVHSLSWLAYRPQHGVHTQIHVGHGIAHEYYLHIVAGVGDSGLAGAEEVEYGVEEDETQGTNSDTHQQVERNGIAQQVLGDTIVALSQFHGD